MLLNYVLSVKTSFYKRDIYLQYAEENSIQYNAFEKGERIEIKSDIFYKVDKIDDYLNNYDVLPTYGTPLVSSKFVKLFKGYEEDVQFLRVNIKRYGWKHKQEFLHSKYS